jgi:hypothetical protein
LKKNKVLNLQLITNLLVLLLIMAELGLVDYFVMGEAVGIVATFVMAFYYSRKQMQKLSVDIETKVLSDLDEKITDLSQLLVEKPQLMKIFSNVDSYQTEEMAFIYYLLQTFAHAYHMHQRKVVNIICNVISLELCVWVQLALSSIFSMFSEKCFILVPRSPSSSSLSVK